MAHYVGSCSSPLPPADVFDYLARFSNVAEWDPGVVSAEEPVPGPPAIGSTYRLVVRFFGLKAPLDYRVVELDPPRRARFRAENGLVRSDDTIEVVPAPGPGCLVTYRAVLTPKGGAALLSPLFNAAFRRIGDRAMAGLQAKLAA